jgi:hypothetical protein
MLKKLTILLLITTSTNSLANIDILNKAISNIENLNIDAKIKSDFIHEIKHIFKNFNSKKELDIDYILVLPGRNSYLKVAIEETKIKDLEDDYNRVNYAINLAKDIAASKKKISINQLNIEDLKIYGPPIIYSGTKEHNFAIKFSFGNKLINDFPADKFILFNANYNPIEDKAYLQSIKNEINLSNKKVAIITHAYSLPRIARMLDNEPPYDFMGKNSKIIFFVVDQKFNSPGALENLINEATKIDLYSRTQQIRKTVNFNYLKY